MYRKCGTVIPQGAKKQTGEYSLVYKCEIQDDFQRTKARVLIVRKA